MYAHHSPVPSRRYPWHKVTSARKWMHEGRRVYLAETVCHRTLILPTLGEERTDFTEPTELKCRECWETK